MRSTAVRRTALAASAAALALLATACGGSSDDGDTAGGDKAGAGETTQAAKALTAAELEKAALTQADVKNGKVATKVPAADDIAKDQVKADNAACQPLSLAQTGVAQGEPAATVKRSWTEGPKKPAGDELTEEALESAFDLDKVLVTLASYEDGGAESALKDLKAAVGTCAGGFTTTAAGEKAEIAKVAEDRAPGGADEAIALTLTTVGEDGDEFPVKAVVTRKGSTVASFVALNLAAAASGKDFAFPTEIVDAQLAKLG
ncbi:hypothetical protein H0H10_28465 [Streptomyces sp. TRM S81-3]|uniref:Lipoprotein n=1 Tax=Streptomyces griseicoloratus TaxID=2752516 RepID=A0A926L5R1_9ACTN|nr:hypothetical protein [Streptomyces griseicoloratus]MBD0423043.1 hypothetical protein [Streptomyces griseicoloratus]